MPKKLKDRPTVPGSKLIWRKEWYVEVYRLAKQGLSNRLIAEHLGISTMTFKRTRRAIPEVEKALTDGRAQDKVHSSTFRDYVYERLPKRLKKAWDLIQRCEEEPNIIKRVEGLLAEAGRRGRQHLFFYAFVHYNFSIAAACKSVNINRKTFERWVTTDPDFAEIINEIHHAKKDFFESALIGLVKEGNAAAILFGNRCLNGDRGYNPGKKISHEVAGQVFHSHNVVPVDKLNLSLEEKKNLLKAYREAEQSPNLPALPPKQDV
jgi:transposase-like protein